MLLIAFCVAKLFLKTSQPHLILDGDADQNYQCGFTSVISVAKWISCYSIVQLL